MTEIGLVLDGKICSDTLSQVEILAEGLSLCSEVKVRIVVLGAIDQYSALWRRRAWLESCPAKNANRIKVFYLPSPRGFGLVDGFNLGRSEALAGCTLLHCFSASLLRTLGSLGVQSFLPSWCISLSHWPGPEAVKHLRRATKVICQSKALQKALVASGIQAQACLVIQPEIPAHYKVEQRSVARGALNLSDEVPLVLADPEMSPWSNHRQLTWAGGMIGQSDERLRILVSGC